MTGDQAPLRVVVALPAEARPLISHFGLKRIFRSPDLYPVYESRERDVSLVVSGIGKAHSAAATAFLAGSEQGIPPRNGIWINFGIAGSGGLDYGETFLASRVSDQAGGRSWYPPAIWFAKNEPVRREVVTVDRPCKDGIGISALVEMEAAGFYPVATKITTSEFCHVIKTVSDDPHHPVSDITGHRVSELCAHGLSAVLPWLEEGIDLATEDMRRKGDPPRFEEWRNAASFSVTQTHQLRRLLQQWNVLLASGMTGKAVPGPISGSSRDCLRFLRNELRAFRQEQWESS